MLTFISHLSAGRMSRIRRRAQKTRRGVTTLESALVMGTLFYLLFVLFDLGLAAFRYNLLAATARRVAREAIVHGAAATPERTTWGINKYAGTGADSSEIAQAAAPMLTTMDPSAVTITVEWPDGNNRENDRVSVHLSYTHHPSVPYLSLVNLLVLQADTTMRIVH
jgi:Flp pilus assembly protein TadG